jgi:hypothetical protein
VSRHGIEHICTSRSESEIDFASEYQCEASTIHLGQVAPSAAEASRLMGREEAVNKSGQSSGDPCGKWEVPKFVLAISTPPPDPRPRPNPGELRRPGRNLLLHPLASSLAV